MSKKFIYVDPTSGFQTESPGAPESSDFISVSTGAPDAGKPVKTNAGGLVDPSFLPPFGKLYTAGTAIAAGDLVFISAADTVSKYTTLSVAQRVIGVALASAASAAPVRVLTQDALITCLTGATAGTPYYWSASGLTTTIPTTSGIAVYEVGVAKNATVLDVCLNFLKINA